MKQQMEQRLKNMQAAIEAQAFHRDCELQLVEAGDDGAEIRFRVNDYTSNPQGALHGGILYAMLDVACFFAVITQLPEDRHPVSVEVHTSVLRAALRGETVRVRSHLDRLGRTLAAMRAEAFAVTDEGEERMIATGSVTKAILEGRTR